MSRRRRHDSVPWGPTGMPDLRRRAGEVLAETSQQARSLPPQERASLPDLERARVALTSADLFWVSQDMTELALDAATDLPAWTPMVEAPSATGLLLYERPLPEHEPTRVMRQAWADGSRAQRLTEQMTMHGMLWACVAGGLTVWPVMRLPQTPPVIMTGVMGSTVPSTQPITDYPPRWAGPIALLGATWVLMSQHAVASTRDREVHEGRDAAIRSRRSLPPARVQVIDLRPMRYLPTDSETDPDTGRAYSHRWVVRGHWRQQAIGKAHAQRRPTWINSYLKGPQDAPLLTGDRVYRWRR